MQEAPAVLKAIFVLGTSSHLIEADTPLQREKIIKKLKAYFWGKYNMWQFLTFLFHQSMDIFNSKNRVFFRNNL